MRARGALAVLIAVGAAAGVFLQDRSRFVPSAPLPTLGLIDAQSVAGPLEFLASDRFAGRAPSTPEGELAAAYLAEQLQALGFAPAGDAGVYFQPVPVVESVIDRDVLFSVGDTVPLRVFTDVVVSSDLPDPVVAVDAEIVFAGFGIVAPEYGRDDYAGVDVQGKVVLLLGNEPPPTRSQPGLFAGQALSYYGRWTYKYEEALRHGAAGVLIVHTTASATYPWEVVQASFGGVQHALPAVPGTPALRVRGWIAESAAAAVVRRAGRDLETLRREALARAAAVPLGLRVRGELRQRVSQATTPNVVGVLRGTEPSGAVILTAHYDHLGTAQAEPGAPDTDRIYNGALDNASGVAGTLRMAAALARAPERPKRSIYVAFTTGEEAGLLGGEYLAAHPPVPLGSISAVINVDELNVFGPSRDLVLLGVERSTIGQTARALARREGRVIALDPEPEQGNFFRSDHFPFARAGVPAVSLSFPTQFVGPGAAAAQKLRDRFNARDYHQPSDEVRPDWNYSGVVADLRLLTQLTWALAVAPEPARYYAADPFAHRR